MSTPIDPELLQDFLTETAELIEQLDTDLVQLESASDPEQSAHLLNSIFRALHTVKGAAGFLGLGEVITFAHAAEDALNRLRRGDVPVTAEVMDAMLRSVDVLRHMTDAIASGAATPPCPDDLLVALHDIAGGGTHGAKESTDADPSEAMEAGPAEPFAVRALELPSQKQDLLSFMIEDWRESAENFGQCLAQMLDRAHRDEAAAHLAEIAESLVKTADFLELGELCQLARSAGSAASQAGDLEEETFGELHVRLAGVKWLLEQQMRLLEHHQAGAWHLDTLIERMDALAAGGPVDPAVAGRHGNNAVRLLALDGVLPDQSGDGGQSDFAAQPAGTAEGGEAVAEEGGADVSSCEPSEGSSNPNAGNQPARSRGAAAPEQTIRVEVGRLESLMNLVGQLVLNKNRMLAVSRRVREHGLPQELTEDIAGAAGDLDRLTSELQVGVMRTRMQPLAKLFDRYPRVIRDMARITDKKINLQIVGKETEVDKSVLELLGDPLIHILRNSADHGIESPADRLAAGKPEAGTIRLLAEHQGSHVRVQIVDDGKGINREAIGRKAVERGMVSAEQLTSMPDNEVYGFIFAPGLSSAEKVSDLSGRGVGMDVVRTNVTRMNGTINVHSVPGRSTSIEILIPLTVAIMPAMVVGVAKDLYCVPLQTIVEIVRPGDARRHTVNGRPVMQLRDSVLPLIDLYAHLRAADDEAIAGHIGEVADSEQDSTRRFAVVVTVGEQRAGLLVDRLVGQQEIVVKPLDDHATQGGPFSGATIREDGQVSLILDVLALMNTPVAGSPGSPATPGKGSSPGARRAA